MRNPICIGSIFIATSTFAQPTVNEPLSKEFNLRYNVGFSSQCDSITTTRQVGSQKNAAERNRIKIRTFNSGGKDLISQEIRVDGSYMVITYALNSRGEVTWAKPSIDTDIKATSEEIQATAKLLGRVMEDGLGGKTYTPGQKNEFDTNLCALSGGEVDGSREAFAFPLGFTEFNGRRALVINNTIEYRCKIQEAQIQIKGSGWDAYDVESGLSLKAQQKTSYFNSGNRIMEQEMNTECTISKLD